MVLAHEAQFPLRIDRRDDRPVEPERVGHPDLEAGDVHSLQGAEPLVEADRDRSGRADPDQLELRMDQLAKRRLVLGEQGVAPSPFKLDNVVGRQRPRISPPKMPRSNWVPIWRPTDDAIERPADCIILSAIDGLAASRAARAALALGFLLAALVLAHLLRCEAVLGQLGPRRFLGGDRIELGLLGGGLLRFAARPWPRRRRRPPRRPWL